jgi:soluble lytic murein transglycosylase
VVPQPFRAVLLLCALLAAGPASADLAAALRAVAAGDWPAARAAARDEIARDVVEWHRLRAGEGTWGDYRDFLARRPDWPGLPLLAEKGEAKIPEGADPAAVTAYFADRPPQTGAGLLRLAEAYRTLGRTGDAEASLVQGWRTLLLRAADQQALLAAYADLLRPHHEARLDMLLWRGAELNARAMLPLVTPGWQRLAAARIGLREQADGVDALIEAVPEALRGDPGLAFERFQWRAVKGRNDDAIALALERSGSAEDLGRPDAWASWRATLARWALREGKADVAYRLAASHRMTEGADYADLEWLAGYAALRFRNDPATALRHFRAFRAVVETPISLGRAGYWEGRALEALGDREGAQLAYELGGEHQTSFYGLLAAEKAGLPMDMSLATGGPEAPDWRQAAFAQSSVLQAALAIREAGDRLLFTRFMLHLAEGFDTTAYIQAGDMALALGEPYTAVALGKQAAERNIIIARAYFPVTALAESRFEVPAELVLAIARRESEFNPAVVSSAGARGLMQVMPGTAEDMARELGIEYAPGRLTTDPAYNARLGAAYLKRLVERFGPSPVLVAAGYNAGPARPARWIEERGDPRSDAVDVIDWIEAIPFTETRTYVMRVAESLPIYRARLTGQAQPMRLSEELRGR